MFNKQLKANINGLDLQISKLMEELAVETGTVKRDGILKEIERLTELRCQLTSSKTSDSVKSEIVGGLISVGAMILVLKHEKADVITTKAFSMATKLFRGV